MTPRLPKGLLLVVAATVLAGPTAGDIGGCGQDVEELDPQKFFAAKQRIDCNRCARCGIANETCERACFEELGETSFPEDCFPLAHDGEVCLRALEAASCEDYASFVDDLAPTAPTECNFCPPGRKPEPAP